MKIWIQPNLLSNSTVWWDCHSVNIYRSLGLTCQQIWHVGKMVLLEKLSCWQNWTAGILTSYWIQQYWRNQVQSLCRPTAHLFCFTLISLIFPKFVVISFNMIDTFYSQFQTILLLLSDKSLIGFCINYFNTSFVTFIPY